MSNLDLDFYEQHQDLKILLAPSDQNNNTVIQKGSQVGCKEGYCDNVMDPAMKYLGWKGDLHGDLPKGVPGMTLLVG